MEHIKNYIYFGIYVTHKHICQNICNFLYVPYMSEYIIIYVAYNLTYMSTYEIWTILYGEYMLTYMNHICKIQDLIYVTYAKHVCGFI